MLAQIADLRLCALMSLRFCVCALRPALFGLCSYVVDRKPKLYCSLTNGIQI